MLKWLVILVFLPSTLLAQNCLKGVDKTADSSDFTTHDDGTVTHNKTGLMWMRCSLGQAWQNGSCSGEASKLSWQQALKAAHGYQYANKDGWRLPNVKELATITERACVRPAIDEGLFPNTPSDDFWTSTPSVRDPNRAWVAAFFNSSNSIKAKTLFVYARLVRSP